MNNKKPFLLIGTAFLSVNFSEYELFLLNVFYIE